MSGHVLLITIGPVQEFIAQARRTRDLWYGSHLLSELSRCAARTLAENGADLVFPAMPKGDPELQPCPAPIRPATDKPPINVANKLVAELASDLDPEKVVNAVRSEVGRFWRDGLALDVKGRCAELLHTGVDDIWDEQVNSFLEFYAAWALIDVDKGYKSALDEVERAIASRKGLREFLPWQHSKPGQPKSSLDGARESVFWDFAENPRSKPSDAVLALQHRYRIGRAEELDAVGLVKRAGGDPEQFVPIVNVALACWTALAEAETPAELDALKAVLPAPGGRLPPNGINLARVTRTLPCAGPFPYDASILLPSRWKSVFEEQGLSIQDAGRDGVPVGHEEWGRSYVAPLLRTLSEPAPYVACLVADGDRMGKAISMIEDPARHRQFSRPLAAFAVAARQIVEQERRGSLVYAGGDDVLAFLPLPEAVACADQLRLAFNDSMKQGFEQAFAGVPQENQPEHPPTLSVGIGIGHIMDGMGDLLELGRAAEKLAKGDALPENESRNALAIILDKRSGGRRSWRARWDEGPADRLQSDVLALQTRLSRRKVYEIGATLARLPHAGAFASLEGPARDLAEREWSSLLVAEVRRSLGRVDAGDGALRPDDVGLDLAGATYSSLHHEVANWIDRVLVARAIADATPRVRRPGGAP